MSTDVFCSTRENKIFYCSFKGFRNVADIMTAFMNRRNVILTVFSVNYKRKALLCFNPRLRIITKAKYYIRTNVI